MDNRVEVLNPASIYPASDLLLWKHPIIGTKFCLYPPLGCSPNLVIHDDLVVASTFSPGVVCAVDKNTGERRWQHRLAELGQLPVAAGGCLLVKDSNSLLLLSTKTGRTLWTFTYDGESAASLPVYTYRGIFIGDRDGVLHCISAKTGQEIDSIQTSRAWNAAVHATGLVWEDLLIVTTNAKLAIAYSLTTGEQAWCQRLPDRSIYQVLMYEGMVLIRTKKSLYGLSLRTGEIIQRWYWRGMKIESMSVAGSTLCVAISNEPGRDEKPPTHPRNELLGIRLDRIQWRLPYPRSSGIALRWDPETRLLYEAMYCGLGIVDPETGKRNALLTGFTSVLHWHTGQPDDEVGLPIAENDRLYVLHSSGTIWALRHPSIGYLR